jgi:hypothetical protein
MGTWGVGAFANDAAADWALEFRNADLEAGLRLIWDALNGDDDELRVAGAEMVAAINGHPASPLPDPAAHDEEDEEEEDDDLEDADVVIYTRDGVADPDAIRQAREIQALFTSRDPVIAVRATQSDEEATDEEATDPEEGNLEEPSFDRDAMLWVARSHPPSDPGMTELARRAVARLTGPDFNPGWEIAADDARWREYMAGLAARLSA